MYRRQERLGEACFALLDLQCVSHQFAEPIIVTLETPVTSTERTIDWLCKTLAEMPSSIRMVYIVSCEHVTPKTKTTSVISVVGTGRQHQTASSQILHFTPASG